MFANFIRLTERDKRGYLEDMSHMDMEELENIEIIQVDTSNIYLGVRNSNFDSFLIKNYKTYDRIYFQVDEVKINKKVDNTNIEMAVFVAVNGLSL